MVERDGLTREFPRMTTKEWRDHRTQEDSTCCHRHRCQSDPGIGDRVRPTNLDMIPQEESIPACVFRVVRELSKQPRIGIGAELGTVECVLHDLRMLKVFISRCFVRVSLLELYFG